jgi:hypothetical protein
MDNARKKALSREYKERKLSPGIFAVRCTGTDAVWVAATRNLDKQQNSLWYQLRTGMHFNKAMQAAWNSHGEASFAYEVLEEIEGDDPGMVGLVLKEREAHWRKTLDAGNAAF